MHRRLALIAATIALGAPTAAMAAQAARFNIRPGPTQTALLQFGVQANVSIGGEGAANCGPTRGLNGRYSVRAGLERLLSGTGCTFRMVDDHTALILPAPRPPRTRPAQRPSPAPRPPETGEVPAPAATDVEAVVVTSPKRSIGLARAPYAITVVQGSTLEEAGLADAGALASRVAGMTVTNLGPGRDKLFLRGLADGPLTGRTQSVVGIYLDDARIIYNAPDPDLRLTDIQRVEVLRGPQGSLYGAGSIGGILQIVTRPPELGTFSGSFSAGGEVTSGGEAGSIVEGVANLPLGDRAAVRLTGYREETGGYIDDPGQGLKDVDGAIRQGLRASLLVRLTPGWSTRLTYIDQTIHSDDSQYAHGPGYQRSVAMREPHRNDFDGLTALAEGDLGFARLRVSSSAQRHETTSVNDATLSLEQFDPAASGPAAFREDIVIDAYVSEATLTSAPGGRLSWLGGVFVSEYSQTLATGLTVLAGPSPLYTESRDDHVDEQALYGEATWRVSDRLRVTAGGRYYRLGVETASRVDQPSDGSARGFEGRTTDSGFAPKLLVEFDWADNLLLYAQAAEGYRSGGFNTSGLTTQPFPDAGGGAQPFRRFRGDELISFEAGARLWLFDEALRLRATLFRARWRDIQSDRLLPNGLGFTANIGDGANTGLELEAAWRRGGWTMEGGLFLNDPELTRPDPGFPIPADRHLSGIASVLGNVAIRYDWRLEDGWSAHAGAEAGYVGRSTLTFDAGLAPRMGGYVTSRLIAGVGRDDWRLSAWVENPLGESGDTFAFGNPFSLRSQAQQTPQRPTTLGAELTRRF